MLILMANARFRSAGVTAAATLAILGSSTALLTWGYFVLRVLNAPPDVDGKHLYELFPLTVALIAAVPPVVIFIGLRLGIGLFQLEPWARLAALIWASMALLFCLGMIAFRPFETFFIPDRFVSEFQSFQQLVAVAFIIMLMPVSIWWLFYFRSKSVRVQFLPADSECSVHTVSPAGRT